MKTINRTLLLLATLIVSLCFTGGRCYAQEAPLIICHPYHLAAVPFVSEVQEKPAPFFAKSGDPARREIAPVIFPKGPVPCGYHPQPAHC